VIICDLDHFKAVNDVHGHAAGDAVLVAAARVLARHELPGRLGGDEFVLWVPGDGTRGKAVASAIVAELSAALRDAHPAGRDVGVSAGVATSTDHGADLFVLLQRADEALYAAKANGRGRAMCAAERGTTPLPQLSAVPEPAGRVA
jgi:sigma-B regulation protein RsbU (phosphoserine phosphatase)